MRFLSGLVDRALPALLMAASVVLLSAGLFAYAPVAIGEQASPTVFDPGDPNFPPTAEPTNGAGETVSPTPSFNLSSPSLSPSASPSGSATPIASATPTLGPGTTGEPGSTPRPTVPGGSGVATRIVVPSLGIDLAVVSGDYHAPGNRGNFPLCDVAQYLMEYGQPGEPGTTYLYAHARTGMFLPLLEQSQRNNGRGMIGALVEVYTAQNWLHLYEIYIVKRHATDLNLAHQLPPAGHQLIMQTSEGPRGTVPKLQVAARPLSVVPADPRDAHPTVRARACR